MILIKIRAINLIRPIRVQKIGKSLFGKKGICYIKPFLPAKARETARK
jgi:hypothetical protein